MRFFSAESLRGFNLRRFEMLLEEFELKISKAIGSVEEGYYCCSGLVWAWDIPLIRFYGSRPYRDFKESVSNTMSEVLKDGVPWFGPTIEDNVPIRIKALNNFKDYVIKNKLYLGY